MAKIKATTMPISGKLDGKIYVKTKHGNIVKTAPQAGSWKPQPAMEKQSSRTGLTNKLASEINTAVFQNCLHFKDTDLYHRMLPLFRDEPANHRFLLLRSLQGLEINKVHRLAAINFGKATLTEKKEGLLVVISGKRHPDPGKHQATGYDYELMLLSYDKTEQPPTVETQLGPWIKMDEEQPDDTCFLFTRQPGLTHWVLVLRLRLGRMDEHYGAQYAESKAGAGMQIVEVGSFDEADIALLTARQQEIAARKPSVREVDRRERKGWVQPVVERPPTTDHRPLMITG